MRIFGLTLFEQNQDAEPIHPVSGSGYGIAPDLNSENGFAELPEASGTEIEVEDPVFGTGRFEIPNYNPPYGCEGMMPPSMIEHGNKMQPGLCDGEEGVGGAGSFLTAPAWGAKG